MDLIAFLQAGEAYTLLFAALAGLAVGSFLNVVVHRLPVMMEREWRDQCREFVAPEQAADGPAEPYNLLRPGSRCPSCGHRIRALENIPVLSFLVLRGRCAACGWRIPLRYPVVEFLTGVASVVVVWQLGFGAQAFAALLLTWSLIALSFIDLDTQLLPDAITLPVLWAGLAFNLFDTVVPLWDAVAGAICGYGILWLVYQGFRLLTGKEGMGHGDFKLLAMLGAWTGWQSLPLIILLSSVLGAVIGIVMMTLKGHERDTPIPFGPYLALAGWISLIWGERIIDAYVGLAMVPA